jgi:hypothetical protein
MLLTITAVSTEVEDFAIELFIESDATFLDLHNLIRQTCGWGTGKPATFYVCDDRWRRRKTIPEKSYEYDTMDEVELGDHLEDEGQRLQYLFDPDSGRELLLEVTHIAFSRHIDEPCCRRSHGTPPALELIKEEAPAGLSREELLAQLNAAAMADDDDDIEPTDDELFDIEELDLEGFDFNEGEG